MQFLLLCALQVAADSTPAARTLARLLDDAHRYKVEQNILDRQRYGLPIEHLPDLSVRAAERDATHARALKSRLRQLDTIQLGAEERLSVAALRWELDATIEGAQYFWHSLGDVTPYSTPVQYVQRVLGAFRIADSSDAARYLGLVGELPAWIDSIDARLAERLRRGIRAPREELPLVRTVFSSYRVAARESPFWVSEARLTELPGPDRARFSADLEALLNGAVPQAFGRLIDYLDGDYARDAPEHVGQWQYPRGKEYYRYLVRLHTTLNVTPEEVHQTGLREVARISRQMAAIRASLGFRETKAEFHDRLKKDRRFYATEPEEFGAKLMAYDARIRPRIAEYFGRVPRAQGDVRRLDPRFEGAMTFGYYQIPTPSDSMGHYFYNGSKLEERSLLMAAPLVYHELIPGHHFQFNLTTENTALPLYRRDLTFTAYTEGWGEYASQLAGEMGMYEDAYERYGRLGMEMFLACRLVVDTGMNYYAWPRSRAIRFMREHALESATQIDTETLRYSVDLPGQALAYKMGALEILRLRKQLRETSGARFDLKAFHTAVMESGALPLTVLRQKLR
ncbi:MAG: DUF885 domain-containing protein [Anaerolineae bacterium]|nr:DUF885 domain-containing protein [Gemmatimonadaceae bacterium]